jgi:DNA replication protein DnaC
MLSFRWEGCSIPEDIEDRLREIIKRRLRRTPESPPVLVIRGSVGAGKSGFVACLLRHRLERGGCGLWIDVSDWLRRVSAIQDYHEREAAITSVVEHRGLVVLDDLVVNERPTDHQQELIYRLVNGRTSHHRDLVVTMNVTLAGTDCVSVETVWGQRVSSRLSAGEIVAWLGPDRRPPRKEDYEGRE